MLEIANKATMLAVKELRRSWGSVDYYVSWRFLEEAGRRPMTDHKDPRGLSDIGAITVYLGRGGVPCTFDAAVRGRGYPHSKVLLPTPPTRAKGVVGHVSQRTKKAAICARPLWSGPRAGVAVLCACENFFQPGVSVAWVLSWHHPGHL